MADMVHGEGLPDGFLEKPKVKAAMMAYKATSSAYELPGAKQVGGPLLDSLSAQYTRTRATAKIIWTCCYNG
jgi:hypothetical protein